MQFNLPLEFYMLAAATLLSVLAFLPASIAKSQSLGTGWLVSNRDRTPMDALPLWGQRAERAHANLKENYPAFAAAIILLLLSGHQDLATAVASATFVGSRILHFVAYVTGVPPLRTLFWALAWGSTIYILVIAVLG